MNDLQAVIEALEDNIKTAKFLIKESECYGKRGCYKRLVEKNELALALLNAHIKRMESEEWQDIETAPKDGSNFLVWCEFDGGKFPPIVIAGKFGDDGFYCQDGGELSFNWNPTLWKSIPTPPINTIRGNK